MECPQRPLARNTADVILRKTTPYHKSRPHEERWKSALDFGIDGIDRFLIPIRYGDDNLLPKRGKRMERGLCNGWRNFHWVEGSSKSSGKGHFTHIDLAQNLEMCGTYGERPIGIFRFASLFRGREISKCAILTAKGRSKYFASLPCFAII